MQNTSSDELELLTNMAWACRVLGIKPARVWALVTSGELGQPARKGTELLFSESEVLALVGKVAPIVRKKRRDEGELYACLFSHFESKTPFAQIVVKEKISPEVVRKAHEEYRAGFSSASPAMGRETRDKLEILTRKERIKTLELETVQERNRMKERSSSRTSDLAMAKAHQKTLELIKGSK